jgi:hypothetical protein
MNSVFLLFHVGENPWGTNWSWIDKWCGIYGFTPIAIDTTGTRKTVPYPPYLFHSVEEAFEAECFAGCEWIWFDPDADRVLDTFDHPKEKVVYALGDDRYGWNGSGDLLAQGKVVRVGPEGSFHSILITPMIAVDRYLYLKGMRR